MAASPVVPHPSTGTSRTVASEVGEQRSPVLPAHADSPAVVIAGAMVGASILVGAGAVAAVGAAAIVLAAVILDDDDVPPEGPVTAPGTPPSERRMGERHLPQAVRGFVDRDVHVSAASIEPSGAQVGAEATARATYAFDGDIRNAAPEVGRFAVHDVITLRLVVVGVEDAAHVPVVFTVDALALSTVDLAQTDARAGVSCVARQDDEVLWRWSAEVGAGGEPRTTSPQGSSQRVVHQGEDRLVIRKLRVPVRYVPPGTGASTVVEVEVTVDGMGARA